MQNHKIILKKDPSYSINLYNCSTYAKLIIKEAFDKVIGYLFDNNSDIIKDCNGKTLVTSDNIRYSLSYSAMEFEDILSYINNESS